MTLPRESVGIQRTGESLSGLVDPTKRLIYLGLGADVVPGDLLGFRGWVRRVVEEPEVWSTAGIVVAYEAAPALLPDAGQLLRGSGPGVLDEDSGTIGAGSTNTVWSGPCLVEPAQSDGSNPEIGDQQVGIVPFTVTVPLALTDIKPGDLFRVTTSRDTRLLTRTLVVKSVRASSSALVREVLAFDNQGS